MSIMLYITTISYSILFYIYSIYLILYHPIYTLYILTPLSAPRVRITASGITRLVCLFSLHFSSFILFLSCPQLYSLLPSVLLCYPSVLLCIPVCCPSDSITSRGDSSIRDKNNRARLDFSTSQQHQHYQTVYDGPPSTNPSASPSDHLLSSSPALRAVPSSPLCLPAARRSRVNTMGALFPIPAFHHWPHAHHLDRSNSGCVASERSRFLWRYPDALRV